MSMNRLTSTCAVSFMLVVAMATAAWAQTAPATTVGPKCPAGTVKGECVNPALAAGSIHRSILFNNARLSKTALPILPSQDWGEADPVLGSEARQQHLGIHRGANPNNIWGH